MSCRSIARNVRTVLPVILAISGVLNCVAATTNRWINSTDSLWRITTNWSAALLPSSSFDYILITNAPTKTVTVDSSTAAINLSIRGLTVSAPTGFTNRLELVDLPAGTALTTSRIVNVDRNAILRITNSTFSAQDTFDVTAGALFVENGGLLDTTTPNFVGIRVGRASGATGTVALNGG